MEPEKSISHVQKMKTHFEELCAKSACTYSSQLRMKRECLRKYSEPTSFESSSDEAKEGGNFVTKKSEGEVLVENSQSDDDNLEDTIYENHVFDATLPLDLPHAIRELILTECDYVYNLHQGLYKYKQPFKFGNLISTTKRNESILFGNITEIWTFHENELLPMFKRNIKNLPKLFNEFEKFIDGIVANAKNNDGLESCERLTIKIEGFINFVDKSRCVSEIREYYDVDLLFQLHLLHIEDFTVHDYTSDRIYLSRVFMFDKCIIYTELIEGQIIYRGSFSSNQAAISMRQNSFTLFENNYQKCEFTAAVEIINRWGDLIRTMMVAADNWSERNSQINNLIASEEVYINNLRKGLSNYGNIFDKKQTPNGLRGKKLTVFGNLEQIADFHEFVLLPMLKNNMYDMKRVFDNFSKLIDDGHFYCYVVYNMNTRRSFKLCEKYEKYFKRCQKKVGDKFGIKALLIQPIQMLDKYPILLKSVITACFASKDISTYNEAIKSCGKLSTKIYNLLELTVEAEEINYIKDAKLNFHYQGRLRKVDQFLIKQANLTRYIGKVFLFDKSIILTKFNDGRLIYQGFYSLIDVRVSFMEGHKEFLLCYGDHPSELGYFLGQQSVMRTWVDMIIAMKEFVGEQQEIYLKEKIFNKFKYFETREFIESL